MTWGVRRSDACAASSFAEMEILMDVMGHTATLSPSNVFLSSSSGCICFSFFVFVLKVLIFTLYIIAYKNTFPLWLHIIIQKLKIEYPRGFYVAFFLYLLYLICTSLCISFVSVLYFLFIITQEPKVGCPITFCVVH